MSSNSRSKIPAVIGGIMAGGVVGAVGWWLATSSSVWKWIIPGAAFGALVASMWPLVRAFILRYRIEDWRLEEVEIQGLKFTSAGAQRRVAWHLFVEIATRISTQSMRDEDGDDGEALKSLHALFQLTRTAIAEMEPTPEATGDTVETYALDMLNNDLRGFLAKWHGAWEEFARGGKAVSQAWPQHSAFRVELRQLQAKIIGRAAGLAQIAGVKNVERFFPGREQARV